jgi:hypothetical protein
MRRARQVYHGFACDRAFLSPIHAIETQMTPINTKKKTGKPGTNIWPFTTGGE